MRRSQASDRLNKKYSSTAHYVLSAFIPYTESNLKLAFKPSLFIDDLVRLSDRKVPRATLTASYYRLVKDGVIKVDTDGRAHITDKGQQRLARYQPEKLPYGSRLMIIFDIPEEERVKRNHLRMLLRELKFRQIQKSVWETEYDSRRYLKSEVLEYGLEPYVLLYESHKIKL